LKGGSGDVGAANRVPIHRCVRQRWHIARREDVARRNLTDGLE